MQLLIKLHTLKRSALQDSGFDKVVFNSKKTWQVKGSCQVFIL